MTVEYPDFHQGPPIEEIVDFARRRWSSVGVPCNACRNRPRCEYQHCAEPADFSVWQPSWRKVGGPGRFKFMCESCLRYWYDAMNTPIPGLDKPRGAPDDWRPSIHEMIRLASIKESFANRDKNRPAARSPLITEDDRKRYTPAQLQQVVALRKAMRKYWPNGYAAGMAPFRRAKP